MVVKLQREHEIALQMIKGKQLQNIQSRNMVLMHYTSSYCPLQLCVVSFKIALMVVNLQSGHEIALQMFKKEITPKISKAELWFLCMIHRLFVLHNCMKFHVNSFNGCQVTEQTRNSIANDQREITPKNPKQSYGSCA